MKDYSQIVEKMPAPNKPPKSKPVNEIREM